jgi:hypothetical protein
MESNLNPEHEKLFRNESEKQSLYASDYDSLIIDTTILKPVVPQKVQEVASAGAKKAI